MKTKFISIATAALATLALSSCDDAWNYGADGDGEGKVVISTSVRSDVKVASRAITGEELNEKLVLWIANDKGVVRNYSGADHVPASIGLLSGRYTAMAWTGDSVAASFDAKCFKGQTDFIVEAGKTTPVDLVCRIANVVASVKYDTGVAEVLSDYTLTVGTKAGTVTFEGDDTRKAYFMMNNRDKDLEWTLSGTMADGSEFTKSGSVPDAQPATEYVLNVRYNSTTEEIGGGYLTVEVDPTEIEVEDEIVIAVAPQIKGIGFDISQPLGKEAGNVGRRSLFITASASLKTVVLESNLLSSVNLGGNDFELLGVTDDVRAALSAAGVNYVYNYDEAEDISNMKLNFEPELLDALENGTYIFNIAATDANGKSASAVFTLEIGGAPVKTVEVAAADVWATKVMLAGILVQDDATDVMFNYRAVGTQAWTQAAPTSVSRAATCYLELTGLEPATAYEYTLSCKLPDGSEFISPDVQSFTTAGAPQLPNAGFEEWDTTSNRYYLICNNASEMFWDCGNQGSATMNKNVTLPDETVKHSGNYSVKLASQFVGPTSLIGAFAAGNIFAGQYLATSGTNGVLGWGRAFAGRPVALKGYIKYSPVAITHVGKGAPAEYVKGEMDKGIVYIALLDGSKDTQGDSSYPGWPVVVRTADKHLFEKDAANVIAYGEQEYNAATAGDGMIEFTIPLDYRRTDIIPTYIVLTASASKGGDYFTGGNGSAMWLDDLELVY
ncbi:MAG: DUF4493 domain-containing protein [Muribaculaceae bacterium]|nr:DUF4493 domain-containing protein [Muribaculaceae bacterium]